MQLGFVGTGTMGNPIAQCLMAAGQAMAGVELRAPATTYEAGYQAEDPRRG